MQNDVREVLDLWDSVRQAVDRVTCATPTELSLAVGNMVIAVSRFDRALVTAALKAKEQV